MTAALLNLNVPPHSEEAEMCVLGACFIDPPKLTHLKDILKPEDFYFRKNIIIFAAMIHLYEVDMPCDTTILGEFLKESGELKAVGGIVYLAQVATFVPTSGNAEAYARIVKEHSLLRQVIKVCTDIKAHAHESPADINAFLDDAEKKILAVRNSQFINSVEKLPPIITRTLNKIEIALDSKGHLLGTPTGFYDLDYILGGLHPQDITIIAARPGEGKTTLALNIACNVSVQSPTAFFSLEMSKGALAIRIICAKSGQNSYSLRTGKWNKEAGRKVYKEMLCSELYIDDLASCTVDDLRAKARRLKQQVGSLGLIVIDYLQLIRPAEKSDSRNNELADISSALKATAKELNVPIIVLSQLNREVERRTVKKPQLSDLRDSGAIEQDADNVLFIWSTETAENKGGMVDTSKKTEIIIAKQRNGATGIVPLTFLKQFNRFESCAR